METTRDSKGRFVSEKKPAASTSAPDLVSFRITNPIVYIKYWWKRIMANEGIEFRLKVKPITALAIATLAFSLSFGLGNATAPIPVQPPGPSPTPTPLMWKNTALKGTLKKITATDAYFLLTSSDEAILLDTNQDISGFVEKKVLVAGSYNQKSKILMVSDIQPLENVPSPTPTIQPSSTSTETPTPVPTTNELPN